MPSDTAVKKIAQTGYQALEYLLKKVELDHSGNKNHSQDGTIFKKFLNVTIFCYGPLFCFLRF